MDALQALRLPLLISPLGVPEPLGNSAELHYPEYKESGRPDQEGDFPHPHSISPSLTPTVLPGFHSPFLNRSN